MPGIYRRSIDLTVAEVKEIYALGIRAVNIYVKVSESLKDNTGKEAWNPNGLMQQAIRAIKAACPEMIVMPDVALDPYSIYGHDGIIANGDVENDSTNDALVKMAVSHAEAGADFVAPSDMMDGTRIAFASRFGRGRLSSRGDYRVIRPSMLLHFMARFAMR